MRLHSERMVVNPIMDPHLKNRESKPSLRFALLVKTARASDRLRGMPLRMLEDDIMMV